MNARTISINDCSFFRQNSMKFNINGLASKKLEIAGSADHERERVDVLLIHETKRVRETSNRQFEE